MSSLGDARILITGGAGLVGSHIADHLVRQRVSEIRILDDLTRGRRENLAGALGSGLVRFIEGDIRDRDLLTEVMTGVDLVFHQAAIRITQCAEEPRLAHDVLATGTLNVLQAAVEAGVQRIVAASSASVYGQAVEFPTPEDHHLNANDTIYGAAKAYLEGMLRSYHQMFGLDWVALRYFNVYGPRMDTSGAYTEVLVRWMKRIDANEPPLIFGDGDQSMDLVHVEDIARANLLAATTEASGQVYNVASGTEVSLKDLAATLLRVMGAEGPIEIRPERAVNPVRRRLGGVDKAARLLGFETRVSLEDGLRSLVDWWREERAPRSGQPA